MLTAAFIIFRAASMRLLGALFRWLVRLMQPDIIAAFAAVGTMLLLLSDRIADRKVESWTHLQNPDAPAEAKRQALTFLNSEYCFHESLEIDLPGPFSRILCKRRTPLDRLDLSNLHLQYVNFRHADLRNTVFDGSDLEGADFCGANLEGVSFKRANLTAASFVAANLTNAKVQVFTPDIVRGALEAANLSGTHFLGLVTESDFFTPHRTLQATLERAWYFEGSPPNLADTGLSAPPPARAVGPPPPDSGYRSYAETFVRGVLMKQLFEQPTLHVPTAQLLTEATVNGRWRWVRISDYCP